MPQNPLGKNVPYPETHAPEVLFGIPRRDARADLGIGDTIPFTGCDLWTAWDLTWLDASGRPRVAVARIRFDALSPAIVESKSLKLYLGSFAMHRIGSDSSLVAMLERHLAAVSGAAVTVELQDVARTPAGAEFALPGESIDTAEASLDCNTVCPERLLSGGEPVNETLHSNLLRSLCPVTAQPDIGSVVVSYRGPRIDRAGLLDYIVSFRRHQAFHESCVERMFCEIRQRCGTEALSVYARYNRRGGLDINPFRTDSGDRPPDFRLWRQ